MNRVGVAFFYDDYGIVDEYMFHLVEKMAEFTTRMIFISNGPVEEKYQKRIRNCGWELIIRDNIGFDVWAYKTAIEHIGYDSLGGYDELLLFNHTFYGPIYPFSEMFAEMDSRKCDFWGITAHKEMVPNPFTEEGILPRHLNSHFFAVRKTMLNSNYFRDYWVNMPMINSYVDSVLTHESRFTTHFEALGYLCSVYDDENQYGSKYPCFINVDESLERRNPILKRRIFFHDSIFIEANAIDLPRALRIMRETSKYDEGMIWQNILRSSDLRTLNTNAALTSVFPDKRLKEIGRKNIKRIAVCAHVYYTEMVCELMDIAINIKEGFDFIATTDTIEKKSEIERIVSRYDCVRNTIVIVLEINRGRDMSALFIACRELFINDDYDLVCRLHTKKSPQVETSRSNIFKRHLYENLLNSEGYVDNVIDMFEEKPWVGLAVPPAVHISYHTLGLGWFTNKSRAIEIAEELDLRVKLDEATPIAPYGTMFWFRPKALRKLFQRKWTWDEFNAEPNHVDGGLAHVLERLIGYTAQDAGYITEQIMAEISASLNYAMLEFKFQKIAQYLPFNTAWQVHMCKAWSEASHYLPPKDKDQRREGFSFKSAWYEDSNISEKVHSDKANHFVELYDKKLNSWRSSYTAAILAGTINTSKEDRSAYSSVIFDFMINVGPSNWSQDHSHDLIGAVNNYCVIGAVGGEDLFPLFDSNYYLSTYSDVAVSGFNPFAHYLLHGYKEMRNPHPLFDAKFYKSKHPQAFIGDTNPLLHFIKNSVADLSSPHVLFDTSLYYGWYPDVHKAKLVGLIHYIKYGSNEGRVPHVLFDPHHYLDGIGVNIPKNINTLSHYLLIGSVEGVDPHALFDIRHFTSQLANNVSNSLEPLTHYLTEDKSHLCNPHPLFDSADYVREHNKVLPRGLNPLEHYLKYGSDLGYDPHPCFSSNFYLTKYPELAKAGLNPLVHFVKYGAGELRQPLSEFDSEYYKRGLKNVVDGKFIPFVHFLKRGWKEGLNPNANFSTNEIMKNNPEIEELGFNPLAFYVRNLR